MTCGYNLGCSMLSGLSIAWLILIEIWLRLLENLDLE
jgi:hypothetical protein